MSYRPAYADAFVVDALEAARAREAAARARAQHHSALRRGALAGPVHRAVGRRRTFEAPPRPAGAYDAPPHPDPSWGLSYTLRRVYEAVAAQDWPSMADLEAEVYGREQYTNGLSVGLTLVRKRLAPFGVIIPRAHNGGIPKAYCVEVDA